MVMQRLKKETRKYHDAIESQIGLPKTLAQYDLMLARFLGIYRPLETRLNQIAGLDCTGICLNARQKTPLLRADLEARGWSQEAIDCVPLCKHLPSVSNTAGALGCLYVMEGATLGGQVISRQLNKDLGITVETGGFFFAGYGADVGYMWSAFGACVAQYSVSREVEDVIVGAACATFEALGRWFERKVGS